MKKHILALIMLILAPNFPTAEEAKDDSGTQVFSDWLVSCEGDMCRMSQVVVQPSTQRLVLQVRVFAGDQPTMLLSFPLGVFLSMGWRFQIDSGNETILPFEICNIDGCHVGLSLTDQLLRSLKLGSDMKVTFLDAAQAEVTPVISLIGFTRAYEAISIQ